VVSLGVVSLGVVSLGASHGGFADPSSSS